MSDKKFCGERLKIARMYRGLTLTELANKVEVTKQSISLYEKDHAKPEYTKAKRIAEVLNFPYDYFFQEEDHEVKTEATYFRSLVSATKLDRVAQGIKLQYVARIYGVLLDYIDFPTINLPIVEFDMNSELFKSDTKEALEEMEKIAAKVRNYWNIDDEPIENLQYLLEKNGIIVTGFDTNEEKIDAFSQKVVGANGDMYVIAVALGSRSQARIRFDMAHELGHILLHPWGEDLNTISKEEFKAREKQANMFASAFLLPKKSFIEEVSEYPTDLEYYRHLKQKWNVSIQAMLYKSHQLEVITDNQYQYLMRQVSKNGWRKKEPDDEICSLNENIFQGAMDMLIKEKVLSAEEILKLLKKKGVTLYSSDIEDILNLHKNTLDVKKENSNSRVVKLKVVK